MPSPRAHVGEIAPDRAVREKACAGELAREEPLAIGDRRGLVVRIEARPREGRGRAFDDEGGAPRLVLIGVHAPKPVLVLLEDEGEGGKARHGTEPDEAVGTEIDLGLEGIRIDPAQRRVDAVRRHHEVAPGEGPRVRELVLEGELDAKCARALLQDVEERLARAAAEAVARRAQDRTLEVDVDVVPMGEAAANLGIALGVRVAEVGERRVGEDDAEAEGVVRAVALVDRHVGVRPGLLHENGEGEPARPAAQARDLHPDSDPLEGLTTEGTESTEKN